MTKSETAKEAWGFLRSSIGVERVRWTEYPGTDRDRMLAMAKPPSFSDLRSLACASPTQLASIRCSLRAICGHTVSPTEV